MSSSTRVRLWKAVEQALGKSGQLQVGDVFRVGMPRTDLSVSVKGVPVKAGFALGSYAAFQSGSAARACPGVAMMRATAKRLIACFGM